MTHEERCSKAVNFIFEYGGIDGGHHKTWVLDQVARILLDAQYAQYVKEYCAGEDGPDTYDWDEGSPP